VFKLLTFILLVAGIGSKLRSQPKTRTGIIGPVTADPNEAIRENGPTRAEVVTNLDFGADGPPLVLSIVGHLGV